jgi:hypothetical protein
MFQTKTRLGGGQTGQAALKLIPLDTMESGFVGLTAGRNDANQPLGRRGPRGY